MHLFWIGLLSFAFSALWAWSCGFSRRSVALASLFFLFIVAVLLSA